MATAKGRDSLMAIRKALEIEIDNILVAKCKDDTSAPTMEERIVCTVSYEDFEKLNNLLSVRNFL